MVPDKFDMVDMEGIDLLRVQGIPLEGIYDKLVESITLCKYQCLYNWKFNDILIPPTYVEMEVGENEEVIVNFGITVTPDDVIHLQTIEPGPVEPVIIPLLAEENMVYDVPSGVDGFAPVTVEVPSYTPEIETLNVTANGTYNAPTGVDGFNPVTVDVDTPEPVLVQLNVTENGNYSPSQGVDGYSSVTVNVSGQASGNVNTYFSYCPYGAEYPGYIYGTDKIEECNLVLLADTSQEAVNTVELLSSINNYSAIVLQGIYQSNRTAQYNTTSLYLPILLNHPYWAGMKDRNSSYTCTVTFTDATHATLTGNKKVLIYGMP